MQYHYEQTVLACYSNLLICNNSYKYILFILKDWIDCLICAPFHGDPHNDYPICKSRHFLPVIYHVCIYMYNITIHVCFFLIRFNVLIVVLNIDSGIKTKQNKYLLLGLGDEI